MNKKTITVILIVVAVIICCCAIIGGSAFFYIYNTTQPAVQVGEAFLNALKNEDYHTSYMLLSPNTQKDIGNADRLQASIRQQDLIPVDWNINSRSTYNKDASMGGVLTTQSGAKIDYIIEFHKIDNRWQINYYGPP